MTSNLVTNTNQKDVRESLKNFFKPEFINRLDEILVFEPLTKEHIGNIAKIQLEKLQKRLMQNHNINLKIDDKALNYLAQNGYDSEFGARPLKRLIQQEMENVLALKILNSEIKDNSDVYVSADENSLIFK